MADTLRTRLINLLTEARLVSYIRDGVDEADGQPYRSVVIRSDEQAAEYAADALIDAGAILPNPPNPVRGFSGRFLHHEPHECGTHRPLSEHRSWCIECHEYCYPYHGCLGCRFPHGVG